jgi:hypothetical protein
MTQKSLILGAWAEPTPYPPRLAPDEVQESSPFSLVAPALSVKCKAGGD